MTNKTLLHLDFTTLLLEKTSDNAKQEKQLHQQMESSNYRKLQYNNQGTELQYEAEEL